MPIITYRFVFVKRKSNTKFNFFVQNIQFNIKTPILSKLNAFLLSSIFSTNSKIYIHTIAFNYQMRYHKENSIRKSIC